MTKEQSFLAKWAKAMKKNKLLCQGSQVTVKVKIATIEALCVDFHGAGYDDGKGDSSIFDKVFGR